MVCTMCAYASVASLPYIVNLECAHIPRNNLCIGKSTHNDHVLATACNYGAAHFEPLQHIHDHHTPVSFTRYCQCGHNMIAFFGKPTGYMGSPNIPCIMN